MSSKKKRQATLLDITDTFSSNPCSIIYLAECISCESSCVGYSRSNLPKHLSNHKSCIKRNIKSCRLANHELGNFQLTLDRLSYMALVCTQAVLCINKENDMHIMNMI